MISDDNTVISKEKQNTNKKKIYLNGLHTDCTKTDSTSHIVNIMWNENKFKTDKTTKMLV